MAQSGSIDAVDADVSALHDLLPEFLDELSDSELLAGAFDDLSAVGHGSAGAAAVSRDDVSVAKRQTVASREGDRDDGKPSAQRQPMQNSTRKRQRQELAYLRTRVEELEAELTGLKQQYMRGSTSTSAIGDANTALDQNYSPDRGSGGDEGQIVAAEDQQTKSVARWERIAKHQLIEKQRAEMRNLKLREMLESQIKVARSLEKVLKKRPTAMDQLDVLELETDEMWTKRLRSLDANEDSLYESLLDKTDSVYAEVDDVCARHASMQTDQEVNDSQVQLNENNQLFLEVTSSKIVPFDLQSTSRAVWRCLSLNHVKLADGAYYRVDNSRDTVAAKAVMKLRISDSFAVMSMRFVMKRFVEAHRVVLACESASESEGPRDVLHGLRMMERGWVIIRPLPDAEGTPSTIIQLCMRMTPSISTGTQDSELDQQQHTGTLTDLMLSALHRNLGWLFQTVENILMEQAVTLS